jgi:uncharacterized protein (DUF362 family)
MEQVRREKVAIVKYDGTSGSLLCDGLDGLQASHKVLLKPNVLWGGARAMPPYGRVTTSAIVERTLEIMREKGCTDLAIGEGTIPNEEMGSSTARGFEWTGIARVAKRYGARLVDFNAGPFEAVELDGVQVRIARSVMECDFLIDIPVLKAHRQTKVSLGMKNLKGCLAIASKKAFHRHDLNRLIAVLNTKVRPSLTIIDGIYGLERGPEFLGTPHRLDLLIAGKDVFSCDLVGATVLGIAPDEVGHLREFALLSGRAASLDGIEVRGEPVERMARRFDWRVSVEDILRKAGIAGVTVQDQGNSMCSGCMAILSALGAVLAKDCPGQVLDGVEICMGPGVRAKPDSKKVFLLGDCAISANKGLEGAVRIKGCAPPILDTVSSVLLKCLPRGKAARILFSRTFKNVGTKLGVYAEAFPAFGVCEPPAFDKRHF